MTNQLDIANRSLLSIGARVQISSLNPSDGSAEANAVSVLWTPTFEALARTAHWNCFRKQILLSLVAAASGTAENPSGTDLIIPPTPWTYAYAYPSDCLAIRYIVPSLPAGAAGSVPQTTINNAASLYFPNNEGQIDYAISTFQDSLNNTVLVVLTNQSQAQAVYTANYPNPALWDSQFQAAMVASLGAYLVPALSLSLPLMQLSIATAERIITQARARDGNEGVTVMDHLPDWMIARTGGWGFGWGGSVWTNAGYVDVAWPQG